MEKFVKDAIELCKPDRVYICTGSKDEFTALMQIQIEAGAAKLLNPVKRPNRCAACTHGPTHPLTAPDSYIVWTDPLDTARSEKDTFICSKEKVCPSTCFPTASHPRGPAEGCGTDQQLGGPRQEALRAQGQL